MSITLNRELEKLESDIRAAVVGGDEFLYSKLNRAKDELTQKIFFAESRNLKLELEALETDRTFNLSVRDDLLEESKQAALVVSEASEALLQAQGIYQAVSARQYFNDTALEQQKKDIRALQQKLQSHINTKLGEQLND